MPFPGRRRHFGPLGDTRGQLFRATSSFSPVAASVPAIWCCRTSRSSPDAGAGSAGGPGVVLLVHVSAVNRGVGRWSAVPAPLVELGVAPGPPAVAFPAESVGRLTEEGRLGRQLGDPGLRG